MTTAQAGSELRNPSPAWARFTHPITQEGSST